jgi:hypothetical protein
MRAHELRTGAPHRGRSDTRWAAYNRSSGDVAAHPNHGVAQRSTPPPASISDLRAAHRREQPLLESDGTRGLQEVSALPSLLGASTRGP